MDTSSLKTKSGLSLVEVIIYVSLLSLVMVLVANFLIQITATYGTLQRKREVVSDARLLLETLRTRIEPSEELYVPTSRLNQTLGQLSLVSGTDAPSGHTTGYVDFWVDNGRMWMRREGFSDEVISGSRVRVSGFLLERIMQGIGRESVKITLQADSLNTRTPASVTLYSTFALRGNY